MLSLLFIPFKAYIRYSFQQHTIYNNLLFLIITFSAFYGLAYFRKVDSIKLFFFIQHTFYRHIDIYIDPTTLHLIYLPIVKTGNSALSDAIIIHQSFVDLYGSLANKHWFLNKLNAVSLM